MAAPTPTELELDPKYDDYDYPTKAPVPQNGHPGYLTAVQQASVHQLRLMLESEGYTKRLDTLTLVRKDRRRKLMLHPFVDVFHLLASLPSGPKVRCQSRQANVRKELSRACYRRYLWEEH